MLLNLVAFADSLGFVVYYTIGMALLGAIAVAGFYTRMMWRYDTGRKWLAEIGFSWFVGLFLFMNITVNLAVFLAFGMRIVFEAIFISMSRGLGLKMKTSHSPIVTLLMIVLGIMMVSMLWNPPTLMKMLDVDEIEMAQPKQMQEGDVLDISYDDVKDIRVVSQEYASQLPRTELVETGFDVAGWRSRVDVYPVDGKLRWISVYEPTIFLKKGEPSPYYVIINAMNPGDREKVAASIKYSERDPFWSLIAGRDVLNTNLRLRLSHPGYRYGDGYYVPELDSWIYPYGVYDYNVLPLAFIYKQVGVAVLDANGQVTLHELGSIPAGVGKYLVLEEKYAEERMTAWARYNAWKDPIDYIFRQPQIFEPAEDLFYQYESVDDRFYALVQFEPMGGQRKSIVSWAEVVANGEGVGELQMFDARDLGLIGPVKATSIIESEVSQYSRTGLEWVVLQPQFKYIRGRYVYVAPIYAGRGVKITIKGIGVVDAKTEQVKVLLWKDVLTGEASGAAGETEAEVPTELPENCELMYTTETHEFYACEAAS